jgi:hypothetical protein
MMPAISGAAGSNDLSVELFDDGRSDALFGIEVVVERTFADAGPLQDVGQSRFAVTQLVEQVDR